MDSEVQGCDFLVHVPEPVFNDDVGTVSGLYTFQGCRKGYPYYIRQEAGEDAGACRVLTCKHNFCFTDGSGIHSRQDDVVQSIVPGLGPKLQGQRVAGRHQPPISGILRLDSFRLLVNAILDVIFNSIYSRHC